jgi:hypothetical protein
MDDFSVASLSESKNEWCARLLNILSPTIVQGLKSIFDEALKLCVDNNEKDKYLMTFQNFLTRVPKWNPAIIDNEKTRIVETSGCAYLEDLVTCVHIIQLKALTCVRVGSKQKKIDIDVPSLSNFIHTIYIHVARKIYTNIYLFEKNIAPLQIQKNNREIELIVKECILNAIRDSVPVESILRAYMDETDEQDVEVKEVEEPLPDGPVPVPAPSAVPVPAPSAVPVPAPAVPSDVATETKDMIAEFKQTIDTSKLSFADDDTFVDVKGNTGIINSPKDEENLEALARARELAEAEEDDDDEEEDERLIIGDNIKLDIMDVNDLNKATAKIDLSPPVLDFEVLV